jgi:two-component system, sensor histidine kinase and response regulator
MSFDPLSKPIQVLVIDDQQENLRLVLNHIRQKHPEYQVLVANNSRTGLQIAFEQLPDIILLDWEMPELSGIEVLTQIKQSPETTDIPVVMCTGVMTDPVFLDIAIKAGAVDFLRKPVEPTELLSRIYSALRLSQALQELKAKNQELQAMNDLKSKLFQVISHDLRSPLVSLYSLLELIEMEAADLEQLKKLAQIIAFDLNNSQNLLDNLLNWARATMEGSRIYYQSLSLFHLTEGVLLQHKLPANRKNITLVNDVSVNMVFVGDQQMVMLMLRNLVSNAIKFTEKGGVVTISAIQDEKFTEITVQDTGIGMTTEQIEQLFNITTHFTTKGTEQERGIGVGLMLCNDFVKQAGGTIDIQSIPGVGTTFSFTLPTVPQPIHTLTAV